MLYLVVAHTICSSPVYLHTYGYEKYTMRAVEVIKSLGFDDIHTTEDLKAQVELEVQKDLLGCDNISCYSEITGAMGGDTFFVLVGSDTVILTQYNSNQIVYRVVIELSEKDQYLINSYRAKIKSIESKNRCYGSYISVDDFESLIVDRDYFTARQNTRNIDKILTKCSKHSKRPATVGNTYTIAKATRRASLEYLGLTFGIAISGFVYPISLGFGISGANNNNYDLRTVSHITMITGMSLGSLSIALSMALNKDISFSTKIIGITSVIVSGIGLTVLGCAIPYMIHNDMPISVPGT